MAIKKKKNRKSTQTINTDKLKCNSNKKCFATSPQAYKELLNIEKKSTGKPTEKMGIGCK